MTAAAVCVPFQKAGIVSSSLACSSDSSRSSTAGELGDDAAQSMRGAEGKAAGTGGKVEPK